MVSQFIPQILKGQALRNWLRTDGAGIFRAFGTGVETLGYIREHFGAIRTQDFYEIRRQVLSVQSDRLEPGDYPGNQLIPKAWHTTDHGLNLSTDYQYRVELFGYDPNTGEIKHQYMTIASDHQLTQDQVTTGARNYIGGGGESGDLIIERFGGIEPLRRV
jgi:hypothetical protein